MSWPPHFRADHQVLYHFGKLLPSPSQGHIGHWPGGLHQWEISISKLEFLTLYLILSTNIKIFLLRNNHYGRFLVDPWKKIDRVWFGSAFSEEKKLKKCPELNLTKGKKVLELPKDAKSAIKKFGPIRSLHCGHVTSKGGFWLVQIFLLQIWHIWAILRPFYPWSNFDPGVISIFFSQKTYL